MKNAVATIKNVPVPFSVASCVTPTEAYANSQAACQIPPMINGHRRPNRSMT
jgi:hypothetical protein